MNITTSTSSSEVNTTTSQAKTSSAKTSDKSFDEELVSQSKETTSEEVQKTETSPENSKTADETTKETTPQDTQQNQQNTSNNELNQTDKIYSGNITFNQNPQNILDNSNLGLNQNSINNQITDAKQITAENLLAQNQTILTQNIQDLMQTKDLMNTVASAKVVENYDAINMSEDDAEFFINLVQNTDMSAQSITTQTTELLMQNSEGVQKSIKVSSVLMEKLSESIKTNQPFRIDFDKNISVIIKVNKDGSLSANFIPGDKAVEQYLKNNIGFLKQRFDDENLSYSELSYSNHKNQQEQKRKKENDNE